MTVNISSNTSAPRVASRFSFRDVQRWGVPFSFAARQPITTIEDTDHE